MERFEQVLRDGYEFKFDQYLSRGWDLFKKGAGNLIGFYIIVIVSIMILSFIPFLGLLSGFLQAAFIAGIYIFLRQLMVKKENFNQFFEGFNSFGNIAVFVIIRFLFILPLLALLFTVVFPFELFIDLISGDIDPEYFGEEIALSLQGNLGTIFTVYFIMIVGMIYIYVSYAFTLPLIADAKLDFWQAMEISRKIIGRKFFMFLLMFIVLGIIAMVGTLVTCFLGIFAVLPYIYCVIFAAYDDILKPDSENLSDKTSDFGVQEKDINTESEDEGKTR
jgi:membrane-anchored glycerophosphoryl diester phosphodiesterase (GDPDase)